MTQAYSVDKPDPAAFLAQEIWSRAMIEFAWSTLVHPVQQVRASRSPAGGGPLEFRPPP